MVTIPNNTSDLSVDINVTETKYCWVQIEAVRTSAIDPKVYSGVNMINYALYPNPDMDPVTCQPKPTVTPTNTATATSTNTPEPGCITTDVKGELNDLEDSNHLTGKLVSGKVSNIAKNPDCSDDIYLHMYGSMQKPTGTGQNIGLNIESQRGNHILTQKIIVPENTIDKPFEIEIPKNPFCTVQVDLTLDGVVKEEPRYIDDDFVLFVDEENCNPKTATATNTAIVTNTPEATSTNVPRSTRTPGPTETPKPAGTPTTMPKEKAVETPVPAKIGPDLPKTGSGSGSQDKATWILFGATAMGVLGLSSIRNRLCSLVARD